MRAVANAVHGGPGARFRRPVETGWLRASLARQVAARAERPLPDPEARRPLRRARCRMKETRDADD